MELPSDFKELMRQQYGEEMAESLFEGLAAEPSVSIRLNPKKISLSPNPSPLGRRDLECFAEGVHAEPVPWCPNAYYLKERPAFTCDPLFHAGAYYVQEASSMYLAEVIRKYLCAEPLLSRPQKTTSTTVQPTSVTSSPLSGEMPKGQRGAALDLCAAPGGKSTLLRSLLPEDWLLISNEPIAKRTQILAENMTKWGYSNTFVTQNYPDDFGAFADTFNLIVTDVPCSGEGMFRKDEGAIRDWSIENVDLCWHRQRDIVHSIWPCLKEDGLLVYSTCTFNHFEDEDNVRWIVEELGAELLEERHFLPGRDRGEGFFIAALKKGHSTKSIAPLSPKGCFARSAEENTKSIAQSLENLENLENLEKLEELANNTAEAQRQKDLEKLTRKIRHGLRCFFDGIPTPTQKDTQKGNSKNSQKNNSKNPLKGTPAKEKNAEPIPPHALAMSIDCPRDIYPECELTYNEALTYLRHEVIHIEAPKGIVLVTFRGLPLGFVKNIGSRANNLYPQEWRIRTTYTTPFCLFSK